MIKYSNISVVLDIEQSHHHMVACIRYSRGGEVQFWGHVEQIAFNFMWDTGYYSYTRDYNPY